MIRLAITLLLPALLQGETIRLRGLKQPVEILRDRWGVPHVYAQTADDLFFANGYINARDRLFQMDLWRRTGAGKLAEVLGPSAVPRDRAARLFRYRGDMNAEWQSYAPDAQRIIIAFTHGINAYIQSRNGSRTDDFRIAGYDAGLWTPEDCLSRISALPMSHNLSREVVRSMDIARFGLSALLKHDPLEPAVPLQPAPGIVLAEITPDVLRDVSQVLATPVLAGSNNWAVDGSRTASGKPLLASDPHRALEIPSLRRTIHLSGPGWNVMGAVEPSVPGIALGHNEHIAWGFTIVGMDQQDLYVEKLNPKNPDEYWHAGAWKRITIEKQTIAVKGARAQDVELRYTVHGPVIYEDRGRGRAYSVRWAGLEPGGAGYLGMLAGARAKNWAEFRAAMARFKTPSENMVYADRAGNIGWTVTGLAPVRRNWTGVLPVPGTGEYEWSGFLAPNELPHAYNPARHFVATANHNILPAGYTKTISYEWSLPYRARRIEEILSRPNKWTVRGFEQMQFDIVSLPARRFQSVLRRWRPPAGRPAEIVKRIIAWDARPSPESAEAIAFELWFGKLPAALFGPQLGPKTDVEVTLERLESMRDLAPLANTLQATLAELDKHLGPDPVNWKWSRINAVRFTHVLNRPELNRGPFGRGGDAFTINIAGVTNTRKPSGASYRQVIDLADWDRSTITNAPGESGDPASAHYADLIPDWLAGRYHPMPFSRRAVEAAAAEKIVLLPR